MRGVTSGSLLGIFLDIFPRRNLPNFAAVIASVAVIASPAVIASAAVIARAAVREYPIPDFRQNSSLRAKISLTQKLLDQSDFPICQIKAGDLTYNFRPITDLYLAVLTY